MNFNVESLPYLYHTEFTDSWTQRTKGVLVDPHGIEYRYEETNGWKPFHEVNETSLNDKIDVEAEIHFANIKEVIKPEVLFHNLSLCKIKKSSNGWLTKTDIVLSDETIADLMNSETVYTSDAVIYDAPTTSYSILVYDGANRRYKQIHLSSTGYRSTKNNSVYTESLVAKFPRL